MICAFLDENGRLFSHRILSRDECLNATSKKDNLKSLFPDDCGDAMVCIIDDREDVWNHATNLIQVKPYHFFQHTGDINAPPGLAKKELDGKGVDFNKTKLKTIKDTTKKAADEKPSEEKSETDNKDPEPEASEANKDETKSSSTESKVSEAKEDPEEPNKKKTATDDYEDNLVEVPDPDDYLLYLESILKLIHERFYESYDKSKETIPDLKVLIPKLKSEVLVGISLVFSGLVPNIVKLEHSRPYLIAKNLGAEVTEGITERTTHLIAASTGTQKVFQAQKNKKILIVTPDWLWTCAERWEHVDEILFPLSASRSHKMRQIPAHCSPDRIPEPDDVKFNNPYLQMNSNDIASMEAEVEEDSTESEEDVAPPEAERALRKRKRSNDIEGEDAEGFHNMVDLTTREADDVESISSDSGKSGRSSSSDKEDEEMPSTKFRRGKFLYFYVRIWYLTFDYFYVGEEISSDLELDSNDSVESVEQPGSEDDDGEWNMMGAALEREFLGYGD